MNETMFGAADKLRELRLKKADIELELKSINSKISETEQQLIELMLNDEIQNFVRAGIQYYLRSQTHVTPRAGCKSNINEWFKVNGFADIVKEAVHPQTLGATVREMMGEDKELPPELGELLHVYVKTNVGIRNGA